MNRRKFVRSITLVLLVAVFVFVPGLASLANAQAPDESTATCNDLFVQKWVPKGNCATNPTRHFLGTRDNKALVFRTNNAERMRIAENGNVGIGTNAPGALLSVLKSGGVQPNVLGIPTGLKVGTPSGSVPLALRQNASEASTPALAYFETSDGDLGSIGANPSTFVLGSVTGKDMALHVNGTTRAMLLDKSGRVGVGTNEPYARLTIKVPDNSGGTVILSATNASNSNLFSVYGDGEIAVGHLLNAPVNRHVCLNGNVLSECSATAQYVPSIDDGSGFPETAELVSIAPGLANPGKNQVDLFAVRKAPIPCDPYLFGIIGSLEAGADGERVHEHYRPLALTGNVAVKVTMEGGFIRRGDPLTSSSKPGYAMKATAACKTIGYALEDARADGTIQVFAHTGENAAPQVAQLQNRVQELEQQNAALAARLAALERALQVKGQPTGDTNPGED